jgi:hypothetical protein
MATDIHDNLLHCIHCAYLSDIHGDSQYVVLHSDIFLGKWHSTFAGSGWKLPTVKSTSNQPALSTSDRFKLHKKELKFKFLLI